MKHSGRASDVALAGKGRWLALCLNVIEAGQIKDGINDGNKRIPGEFAQVRIGSILGAPRDGVVLGESGHHDDTVGSWAEVPPGAS